MYRTCYKRTMSYTCFCVLCCIVLDFRIPFYISYVFVLYCKFVCTCNLIYHRKKKKKKKSQHFT